MLVIHVFDYARLPRGALEQTAGGAGRILAGAGIETEWRICSVPALRGACGMPDDSESPIVRIIPKGARSMAHVFGAAIKAFDGGLTGVYATIFCDRVTDASRRFGMDRSVLLSCSIAHEVGELFGLDHAPEGIMHAVFDGADIERAARGRLRFSTAQAAHLRDVVLMRLKRRAPAKPPMLE